MWRSAGRCAAVRSAGGSKSQISVKHCFFPSELNTARVGKERKIKSRVGGPIQFFAIWPEYLRGSRRTGAS
jgi:hypothetical protein